MPKNNSHFRKGSGCYTCSSCGKQTRSTGRGDNEHCGLCVRCYDMSGDENAVLDGLMTQAEFDAKWKPIEPTTNLVVDPYDPIKASLSPGGFAPPKYANDSINEGPPS